MICAATPRAESFRRAWEAAFDVRVGLLRDELFERAIEGQLKPVFLGGKLKSFQRVKNDRLLMFALRMARAMSAGSGCSRAMSWRGTGPAASWAEENSEAEFVEDEVGGGIWSE